MTTAAATRSQQRYRDWLRSEADMTFGDWLKAGGDPEPDYHCWRCDGTGMGQYDGGRCWTCSGTGENRPKVEGDDY